MRTRDEQKEALIRQKAQEMIVRHGFDGLSMHKLAKAAEVSPATIYIYFKDRDDLILQLAQDANNRMTEATLRNFDPDMHFADGLRVQWINRAKYCMEYPLDMLFMEQIRLSPYYTVSRKKMNHSFIAAMRTFVQNAIKREELIPLQVEVYWSIAFAPLYQLVQFHMRGEGMPGCEKFVLNKKILDQTIAIVIKALTPENTGKHHKKEGIQKTYDKGKNIRRV